MKTKNNQKEVAVEFPKKYEAEGYYLVKICHCVIDAKLNAPIVKFMFEIMKNGISLENGKKLKNTKGLNKFKFYYLNSKENLLYFISQLKALETYGLPITDYTKITSMQLFEIIFGLEDFKNLHFGIKVKNSEKEPSCQIITIIPKEEAIKVGLIIK